MALLKSSSDFVANRDKIIEVASELEAYEAIPAVKAHLAFVQEVQTEDYWRDVTLAMTETLRRKLRSLVQFIKRKAFKPVYSILTDQKGDVSEIQLQDFSTGVNLVQYRRKVEAYIRANEQHVAIAKLRHNRPLTPTDLSELERFVYESEAVQGRERFEKCFGQVSLPAFIRSLVGLDRNAAKEAFGRFLDGSRYNSQQIRFVEMIIERLTRHGVMEASQLYEPPFTAVHYEGLDGAFGDTDSDTIVSILRDIHQHAA